MTPRDTRRTKRTTLAILAIVTAAAGVYAVTRSPRDTRGPVASPPAEVATELPAASPSAATGALRPHDAVPRATGAASVAAGSPADRVAALRRGLASDDVAARIAAIEAAASTTAVETLADLETFDLARDPAAAPTVIHTIALLGASAEGPKRDEAAGTLQRWLRDELRRESPDAPGNVSNLVEALGNLGGARAVDALVAALDQATLALHVQTLAVMKLGELGDARARKPVERFAARVAALPTAEGIDEELRVEAIEAARITLSRI